jgi:predicted nucleic acid-binding protein
VTAGTSLRAGTHALEDLDFHDAYQYATAGKLNLESFSLDGDFDRTESSRKTPSQLLA